MILLAKSGEIDFYLIDNDKIESVKNFRLGKFYLNNDLVIEENKREMILGINTNIRYDILYESSKDILILKENSSTIYRFAKKDRFFIQRFKRIYTNSNINYIKEWIIGT